ncbi:hypothetical protein [Streptomyces sp. NPDC046939]|uniref:hypothetical protein n=1 Tax=Streptomyces sp. NPDC046939 TaxID=3155376 RepID=UPI0033F029E9
MNTTWSNRTSIFGNSTFLSEQTLMTEKSPAESFPQSSTDLRIHGTPVRAKNRDRHHDGGQRGTPDRPCRTSQPRHAGGVRGTLAAAALACAGRWPLARACSTMPLVLLAAQVPASAWLLPLLAMVVLMPTAAAPAWTDRRLTYAPVLAAALAGQPTPGLGMIGNLGPILIVLALRAAAPGCRPRHLLAVLAASVPWAAAPTGSPIGLALVTTALMPAAADGRAAATHMPRQTATRSPPRLTTGPCASVTRRTDRRSGRAGARNRAEAPG